eukprot:197196-Pleurochrysis_carterae.AAC.1
MPPARLVARRQQRITRKIHSCVYRRAKCVMLCLPQHLSPDATLAWTRVPDMYLGSKCDVYAV